MDAPRSVMVAFLLFGVSLAFGNMPGMYGVDTGTPTPVSPNSPESANPYSLPDKKIEKKSPKVRDEDKDKVNNELWIKVKHSNARTLEKKENPFRSKDSNPSLSKAYAS